MSVFISLFTIALNAILAENFILVKFMGICPFMGVSKKQDTALGMASPSRSSWASPRRPPGPSMSSCSCR